MVIPLTISSSVQFLLAGPIAGNDGIIIQSNELGIDLIGMAHNLYYLGDIDHNEALSKDKKNFSINHLWSKEFIPKSSGRKFQFLFVWRTSNLYLVKKEELDPIKKALESFIEDIYPVLNNITAGKTTTPDQESIYKSRINWKISPLILQCHKTGFFGDVPVYRY